MARQIGTILRLAALCVLVAVIAACSPVERPRLGSGPPMLSPKTLRTLGKPAPTSDVVTFALDPITNAPGEMIYAFEDALKAKAPTRQLKIVAADDSTANYRLKAYLSAVGDYSGGLVLYVGTCSTAAARASTAFPARSTQAAPSATPGRSSTAPMLSSRPPRK